MKLTPSNIVRSVIIGLFTLLVVFLLTYGNYFMYINRYAKELHGVDGFIVVGAFTADLGVTMIGLGRLFIWVYEFD